MNRLKTRILTFGIIALVTAGIAQNSSANLPSDWVVTGTTSLGGQVIVNGSSSVGPLTPFTTPGTSFGGGDNVTLGTGATAYGATGATISFMGPNNTFTNNGTVDAPNFDKSITDFANTGVGYYNCSGSGIINQTFVNNGVINGGDGMVRCATPIEDTGVAFYSTDGIYSIGIVNTGDIYGGSCSLCSSGSGSSVYALGAGIALIDVNEIADINGVSLQNSGIIAGGTNLTTAYVVGTGVAMVSYGNVENISIVNTATGVITGGSNTSKGEIIGSGVVLMASPYGADALSNISVNNAGLIAGGNFANNEDFFEGPTASNVAGSGLVLFGGNGVYNVNIANSGTIQGGSYAYGGNGECTFGSVAGSGLAIFDQNNEEIPDINGVTLNNTGAILGGMCSDDAYIVGTGVGIVSLGNVLNVEVNNYASGVISGGNGNYGEEDDEFDGGVVGSGLGIVAGADGGNFSVSNVAINNAGTIAGGSRNEEGIVVGAGVGIAGSNGVYGVTIGNIGTITGGNNNEEGTILGSGIGIYDDNEDFTDINGVVVANTGVITGGSNNRYGSMAGVGVGILGDGNVSNVLLVNTGLIAGGNNNTYDVDFGGEGVLVASYEGKISNVSIQNYGTILGGAGIGNYEGADGIDIEARMLSDVYIHNYGLIAGGNGGNGMVSCEFDYGQDGGTGVYVDSETCADPDFKLVNELGATILGGNGGNGASGGGNGGDGVYLNGQNTTGVTITNYGSIIGGNAGTGGGGYAGIGVETYGNNITINNYGLISAGSGASQATVAGYPAVAISVSGSNNTINLRNHSSVVGTLQGVNSGANNVLNLDFTGVSAQALANLKAQLTAQGWPGTNDFTGTFTFRGVTYYVDPLILNLNTSSYSGQGITPNQISVGNNLNGLPVNPTGDLLTMFNAIDGSGNVPEALEALSPQRYQIYGDIAESDATFMTLSIDERLNNLRDGSESVDTSGIGGSSDVTTTAGYDKDGKTVVVPDQKSLQKRWGFFAEGTGDVSSIDGHGGDLQGASFTSAGLMLGVDGKINDNLVAGLLFDYSYTTASLDAVGSQANIESYGGGIYSGYHNGGWYANGLAAYGSNNYDSTRMILFPGFDRAALASTNGNQEQVNIDGGYDFHVSDRLSVGPLAGVQYVHLNVDGFQENGAGAADLTVGSQSVDSLRSRIGFHAQYKTQIAKEVAFATEFRAAYQHEFLDNSHVISSAFTGSGLDGFGVVTTNPQRDAALVGIGANFTIRDKVTLFFDYDVQAGQQSYFEQSFKGGFKIAF